jgi:hypothetical protein
MAPKSGSLTKLSYIAPHEENAGPNCGLDLATGSVLLWAAE